VKSTLVGILAESNFLSLSLNKGKYTVQYITLHCAQKRNQIDCKRFNCCISLLNSLVLMVALLPATVAAQNKADAKNEVPAIEIKTENMQKIDGFFHCIGMKVRVHYGWGFLASILRSCILRDF